MGLFDKLFDKKICAICGGEIGLLGNRKLADGNLCKDCASKLSPYLTDRKQQTVEEIREHLAYREENARVLLGVHPTRVFGHNSTKVYVDENQGLFFVTAFSNYMQHNPDVISVSQVIDVRPSIHENREELYHHDRDGKRVPYNPPRYRVEYRFNIELNIDSPYFNQIRFELTGDRPDSPISEFYRQLEQEVLELQNALNPASYAPVETAAGQSVAAAKTILGIADEKASDLSKKAEAADTGAKAFMKDLGKKADAVVDAQPEGWTCACGQVNQGNFCVNCGAKKPVVFRCDKCGWQPADPNNLPKFCPNCGDPFNEEDVG